MSTWLLPDRFHFSWKSSNLAKLGRFFESNCVFPCPRASASWSRSYWMVFRSRLWWFGHSRHRFLFSQFWFYPRIPGHASPECASRKNNFSSLKNYSCVLSAEGQLDSNPGSCLQQARTKLGEGNMLYWISDLLLVVGSVGSVESLDFLKEAKGKYTNFEGDYLCEEKRSWATAAWREMYVARSTSSLVYILHYLST